MVGPDARVGADLMDRDRTITQAELAEIIQAGDALCAEVENDATDLDDSDPGSSYARLLRAMCAEWKSTVKPYRIGRRNERHANDWRARPLAPALDAGEASAQRRAKARRGQH